MVLIPWFSVLTWKLYLFCQRPVKIFLLEDSLLYSAVRSWPIFWWSLFPLQFLFRALPETYRLGLCGTVQPEWVGGASPEWTGALGVFVRKDRGGLSDRGCYVLQNLVWRRALGGQKDTEAVTLTISRSLIFISTVLILKVKELSLAGESVCAML